MEDRRLNPGDCGERRREVGSLQVSRKVNVGEEIGKTVGKRTVGDPLSVKTSSKEHAQGWHEAFGSRLVPRGVYRFKSHEEADAWMIKMISRPRKG